MKNMRHGYFFVIVLVAAVFFCTGCGKKTLTKETVQQTKTEVVYEGENIGFLTAGDGTLYFAVSPLEAGETYRLSALLEDGAVKDISPDFLTKNPSTEITALLYEDNMLYVAVNEMGGQNRQAVLYGMPLDGGEEKRIAEFSKHHNIRKIIHTSDGFCLLAQGDNMKEPVLAGAADWYSYGGEVLIDENDKVLFDDFPVMCEKIDENNILLYAHEDGEGFYFTQCLLKNNGIVQGEKKQKDLGQITNLVKTDEDRYIYISMSYRTYAMEEIGLQENVVTELLPDRGIAYDEGDVCTDGNRVFYRVSTGVSAFNYQDCKKKNKVIHTLLTEDVSLEHAPFGCGYQMTVEQKTEEEMALSMLSQDADYDLFCMQSESSFGYSVREKGNFYPLTQIEGMQEYLDSCFPYVRKAATDEDGEIWMLPISVSAVTLLYSPKLCEEYGFFWGEDLELADFLDDLELAVSKGGTDQISITAGLCQNVLLSAYADRNDTFDTDEFRKLAVQLIRMEENQDVYSYHEQAKKGLQQTDQDRCLAVAEYDIHMSPVILANHYMKTMRLPGLNKKLPMPVSCYFVCINAASQHLEEAADYIQALVAYQNERTDSLMRMEKDSYTDGEVMDSLYQLYENAEIVFSLPAELYWKPWEEYRAGNMTLEEMIQEADRKIAMYRKE